MEIQHDETDAIQKKKIVGRIYKITSEQTPWVYYGSTTKILSQRFANHKKKFDYYSKGTYHYVTSFEILKYGDAIIQLISEDNYNNKQELARAEGIVIGSNADAVNKIVAGRTDKEYGKLYHENHKEQIHERQRTYHKEHREHILARRKIYYEQNKAKFKEYRDQHKEHYAERIQCDVCSCSVMKILIARHNKTKKHQDALALSSTPPIDTTI